MSQVTDSTTAELADRLAILELTARLALTVDARDWDGFQSLFTDPVHSDRTSLFGGDPQTGTPAELVGGLRYALGGLDATHHLISCQSITLDGDEATSAANMQGIHVLANPSGASEWIVAGRHDYQLTRTSEGWKIAAMTFTVQWATGNQNILALSAARNG